MDAKRIGVTGRSGGGAYTWWTAALDDRPACFVPVAGITDLENHVVDGCVEGHCDCMYMVNTYRWDFATVAALCAPRPLMLANSDADEIFPVAGYQDLAERVRKIYKLYGAEDKFALLELWDSPEALANHAKLQAARPPLPEGLRQGAGEREDYTYNRTR